MKIKSKNISCRICQNSKLSEIINPLLFDASISFRDLSEKLENDYLIFLSPKELERHASHIYVGEKYKVNKKVKEKIRDLTSDELIDELIAIVKQLLKEADRNDAKQLVKLLKEVIELKMKSEGVPDRVELTELTYRLLEDDGSNYA